MAFQKSVNIWQARGLSGQLVSMDGFVPTPVSFMSDGKVDAGMFVFEDTAQAGYCCKNKASARFLGFVVRTLNTSVNVPVVGDNVTYPKNTVLTIAQRGQLYYTLPTGASDVTSGKHVAINPTNGAVTFVDAGTANDTGWAVWLLDGATTAKDGDLVIVQNIGVNNLSAGA